MQTQPVNKLSVKNKTFWALSKPEKRVAIAKDIIKQIAIKKIKPKTGSYIEVSGNDIIYDDIQMNKLFEKRKCKACALGSCFISLVNLGNNLKISDIDGWHIMFYRLSSLQDDNMLRVYLRKHFTSLQLVMIESAFEVSGMVYAKNIKEANTIGKAITFGKKYKMPEDRLIAICKNIIKYKGYFKP